MYYDIKVWLGLVRDALHKSCVIICSLKCSALNSCNSNGDTLHGITYVNSFRTARYFVKNIDLGFSHVHNANVSGDLLWILAPDQLLFLASLFIVLLPLSAHIFYKVQGRHKPWHHLKNNMGLACPVAQWGWETWSLLGHAKKLFTILKLPSSTIRDA